jgi:hypothetical protein
MNIKRILANGLKTGLVMSATTNAAIMLLSDKENGNPWAAVNSIAHIVDGDEKEQPTVYSPRESALGIIVNGTAMCAWGVLYEGALEITKTRSNPLTATLGMVASYVIDYKLVPKQYTPGIEKRLSQKAILATYLILGTTLALSQVWNRKPTE